jgi:hypothetical protein
VEALSDEIGVEFQRPGANKRTSKAAEIGRSIARLD